MTFPVLQMEVPTRAETLQQTIEIETSGGRIFVSDEVSKIRRRFRRNTISSQIYFSGERNSI